MRKLFIPSIAIMATVISDSLSAGPVEDSITRVVEGSFAERQEAELALSALVCADPESVLPVLLSAETQRDPEMRLRTSHILRALFERQVLGIGATTLGGKIGTLLWVDEKDLPRMAPLIEEITPGSAAEKAGLKAGDCIRFIDGRELDLNDALGDFRKTLAGKREGDKVHFKVLRVGLFKDTRNVVSDGEWFECDVVLEARSTKPERQELPGEFAAWRDNLAKSYQR